jgi:hypothetical protein
MRIIERDLHARQQTLAMQDTTTRLGLELPEAETVEVFQAVKKRRLS